ncbi:defensin-like protein 182 [Spinacia oleracea]|uniref:Defensin-like protein n=1 Tax=Spinacia oleracea TaxID=3562 RepID=A0ABM3R7I0_SPIOL|nr:defensin-like protein 182 [Spinacia oleracea]
MAKHFSCIFALIFVFLLIQENMTGMVKADAICQKGLGECKNDCDARCTQLYGPGTGKCDYTLKPPLCTCYYKCGPPSGPPLPPVAKCHENDGECSLQSCNDDCCTTRCKAKLPGKLEVVGSCQQIIGTPQRLCLCDFDC